MVAAKRLEELVEKIAEEIGEVLYPGDRNSGNDCEKEEGNEQKVDYYRTHYIEWEAKEVNDLVSSDNDFW